MCEKKGFLDEHFHVDKANILLSDKDKQILIKHNKTERQLLSKQDKKFNLIEINTQESFRLEIYDFGAKIKLESIVKTN